MRKHAFAVVLLLILFMIGGIHTHNQIKANSPNTHKEDSATTRLSGFALNSDSWTTGGPYGGYINSLAMAVTDPDVLYAGTESGVFKTADGGDTWTKTGFSEMRVQVVQVAPDDPDIVYAGADDGVFGSTNQINGLYKSEDGGSTWAQKGLTGALCGIICLVHPLIVERLQSTLKIPLLSMQALVGKEERIGSIPLTKAQMEDRVGQAPDTCSRRQGGTK